MASSEITSGALVTLQDLHPSSPYFKQGASLRVTGKTRETFLSQGHYCRVPVSLITYHFTQAKGKSGLHDYSVETAIATIVDGSERLKINTQHLRELSFRVGSIYQFIGELLIQPDNEAVLQARMGRNVDGIDLNLYHQSLQLLRQFQADHLKKPAT
ncbi:hypothetical protein C1H46_043961 [Malus baccata]|uniref:CST complex subunit TEN1 n=1 Tax=Malus baccata TaxID=106549 RepID=A0A540K8L1_MALBA|nr:hypothetical protein C1H46_043961 [Malus baccata]